MVGATIVRVVNAAAAAAVIVANTVRPSPPFPGLNAWPIKIPVANRKKVPANTDRGQLRYVNLDEAILISATAALRSVSPALRPLRQRLWVAAPSALREDAAAAIDKLFGLTGSPPPAVAPPAARRLVRL